MYKMSKRHKRKGQQFGPHEAGELHRAKMPRVSNSDYSWYPENQTKTNKRPNSVNYPHCAKKPRNNWSDGGMPDLHFGPGPHSKPDPRFRPGPHSKSDPRFGPGPHSKPDSRFGSGPHSKPDHCFGPGPHSKPDPHFGAGHHSKPDSRFGPGPHSKPDPHFGPGPHSKPDLRFGPGHHSKPDPHFRLDSHFRSELQRVSIQKVDQQLAAIGRFRFQREILQFMCSAHELSNSADLLPLLRILSSLLQHDLEGHEIHSRAFHNILGMLLEEDSAAFLTSLNCILCKMPSVSCRNKRMTFPDVLHNVYILCKYLLSKYPLRPTVVQCLPVDAFCGCTRQLAGQERPQFHEFYDQAKELVELRDEIRADQYQLTADEGEMDNTALPTPDELKSETLPLDLPVNVTKGPYNSPLDYITLHYRLLREDFIHPLRCALHKIRLQDEEGEESHEIKIYENVQFTNGISGTSTFKVSFELPGKRKAEKVNWEHSKRFTYGSLLCLSCNGFKTILFATVAERTPEELQKGIVTVNLETDDPSALSADETYRMIDSPGFYAAYNPVLKQLYSLLNNTEELSTKLPFTKHLVECNTNVGPPEYAQQNVHVDLMATVCNGTCKHGSSVHSLEDATPPPEEMEILDEISNDMPCDQPLEARPINQEAIKEPLPKKECKCSAINPFNKSEWDQMNACSLDSSQKEALHTALTKALALIQGPPGTGKTYIGLKIVKALLHNRQRLFKLKSPIVIVCYTNHALDQFLKGVIDIVSTMYTRHRRHKSQIEVRRVGGRCKNEDMKRYNIRGYVNRACSQRGLFSSKKALDLIHKRLEALEEFLTGKYDSSHSQLYCYFLRREIVDEFPKLSRCTCFVSLSFQLTSLAGWLYPHFHEKVSHYEFESYERPYSYHKEIEDDRRDDEDFYDGTGQLHSILGETAVEEFVSKLGSSDVQPLHEEHRVWDESLTRGIDNVADSYRLQMFKWFLEKVKDSLKDSLRHSVQQIKQYEEQKKTVMVECLREADVIGLTTTGAAKNIAALSQINAKVVIVEEAAEVLEAHVITTLTRHTQQLILIGDHKQLSPKTNDHILSRDYNLNVSLFERLINNGFPHVTLQVQHRMRPEIASIVSSRVYNGELENAPNTLQYKPVKGMKHNMFFIEHEEKETPNVELKSPENDHEAAFLVRLACYLCQQGYSQSELTVLTPYTGQMFNLRKKFKEQGLTNIHIIPVDSFQGEENEVILLSLVRSNKPGFVKDDKRVCVALSRAKQGFYCIGNFSLFQRSSKLWKLIIADLSKSQLIGRALPLQCLRHKRETEVAKAEDFDKVSQGGCGEPCQERLACHHVCPYPCHPTDTEHKGQCKEPCPETFLCGHRCLKLCSERCGLCQQKVQKRIPKCGHEQQVPCYKSPEDFVCQEKCTKTLECGHPCTRKCGEECTAADECKVLVEFEGRCGHTARKECRVTPEKYAERCQLPCNQTLDCEHICAGKCGECHQGRLHKHCMSVCTRPLLCEHQCTDKCAKNCPPCKKKCMYLCPHGPCGRMCSQPCKPCPHRCKWECRHHKCTRNCGDICNPSRCDKPCFKILPKCGHKCVGLCGEPCIELCRECEKTKWEEEVPIFFGTEEDDDARFIQLTDCGHIFEAESLDHWFDQEQDSTADVAIQWKACPKCKTPVFKTLRYANVKKQIIRDMNKIKKKQWYALGRSARERVQSELKEVAERVFPHSKCDYYVKAITSESFTDLRLQKHHIIFSAVAGAQKCVEGLKETALAVSAGHGRPVLGILHAKWLQLMTELEAFKSWALYNRRNEFTSQMQSDAQAEQRRISLLAKTYTLLMDVHVQKVTLNPQDSNFLNKEIVESFEAGGRKTVKLTTEDESIVYESLETELCAISKRYKELLKLTEEEKSSIIRALGAKPGSWYKCKNGHVYNIGQCGGAMETSKCPECGGRIGGRNHSLRQDNQHASEFDGSRHAAWSTGANLRDYGPEELRRMAM